MNRDCKIYMLYSGSGGNSAFVRIGNTSVLIDAGKSARALSQALTAIGEDIKQVDAIFITHEHTDHVSALEVISKKYHIPIYITDISARRFDSCPDACVHSCLKRRGTDFCECVGDIRISSFKTPHDSNMSVGYRIEFESDGKRYTIGYATDIGYVSDDIRRNLMGCESVVIEANHDLDMLMSGPYPRDLKRRIMSQRGHLSNADCAAFVSELASSGTRHFMLAHLSKENNEPSLALEAVSRVLNGYDASVVLAHPDEPVRLELDIFDGETDDKCKAYCNGNA